jgi:hypothetical protein
LNNTAGVAQRGKCSLPMRYHELLKKKPLGVNRSSFLLHNLVGLGEFESPTSSMSRMRSNQLSYSPIKY